MKVPTNSTVVNNCDENDTKWGRGGGGGYSKIMVIVDSTSHKFGCQDRTFSASVVPPAKLVGFEGLLQ